MCVSVVSAGDGLLRLGSTDFCQQCFGSFYFFNQKGLQSRTELYTLQLILKVSLLLLLLLFLFFF